jgi:D-threo-aldose 1-dehydrogenase
MKSICEDAGIPLAAAAIQFPLAHPSVAAVIPGAKSPSEPTQNHAYMHTPVPAEVWEKMKSEGFLDAPTPT